MTAQCHASIQCLCSRLEHTSCLARSLPPRAAKPAIRTAHYFHVIIQVGLLPGPQTLHGSGSAWLATYVLNYLIKMSNFRIKIEAPEHYHGNSDFDDWKKRLRSYLSLNDLRYREIAMYYLDTIQEPTRRAYIYSKEGKDNYKGKGKDPYGKNRPFMEQNPHFYPGNKGEDNKGKYGKGKYGKEQGKYGKGEGHKRRRQRKLPSSSSRSEGR